MAHSSRRNGRHRNNLTLREEFDELGRQIAHLATRSLEAGEERLTERVDQLKSSYDALSTRLGDRGQASLEAVTEAIERRPIAAVISAMAAGIVVSQLLRLRSH